jgi:hypothetical protein
LTEKDTRTLRRTVSENHTTTAAQVREDLNIHLEETIPQKLSHVSFTNATSTVGL